MIIIIHALPLHLQVLILKVNSFFFKEMVGELEFDFLTTKWNFCERWSWKNHGLDNTIF